MAEDDILKPVDDDPIGMDDDDEPLSLTDDDEPISLVEESDGPSDFSGGTLKTFGAGSAETEKARDYRRALNTDGTGATRCRIFHSKIAIASLEFMESQINEWLDGDNIEVKQVGHIIGTMEGKRPEPNLLVLVWY